MTYANSTSVDVDRTKGHIERLLQQNGAAEFCSGWDKKMAMIGFSINGRYVRMKMPLPNQNDDEFALSPGGRKRRSADATFKAWEQACRSRWRALLLVIKAKLEAIEIGITTFEDEFLAYTVLPNGLTLGEYVAPKLDAAIKNNRMPKLLIMGEEGE